MCQQGAGWLVAPSPLGGFRGGRKTRTLCAQRPTPAVRGTTPRCVGELPAAAGHASPAARAVPERIAGLSVAMLSTSVSAPPHSYALLVTAGLEDVAAASIAELLPGLTIRVLLC